MTTPSLQNDAGLDEVIAGFLEAEEIGRPIPPAQVVVEHPEFADELRNFFADRDLLRSAARPLADAVVARRPVLGKIRYFGDYELLEEVARGGMGIVYKARQVSLNRVVAVKMILAGNLASEVDVHRFQIEAEAAARLQHPNIVSVHEVGRQDGQSYFSMEYVDGGNLSEIIREDPLPIRQAAKYVAEIAQAVHHAHRQGTLHRDLKPSNVMIDAGGRVRITDFGLALNVESNSQLTASGQALGTPAYMPPEQAQGKRGLIGPASDVYSLGAILYELLTGRPPFRGESPVETIRQVIDDEPVSPRLLNSSVSPDLDTICLKCLEKEPHRRYATAEHLADDLQRFLDGKPIHARPIGRVARLWRWCRRRPLLASLSGALMIAIVGSIIVLSVANYRVADALDQRTDALDEARTQQRATAKALAEKQAALTAKQAALTARDTANAKLKAALQLELWRNYVRGIELVQRKCEAGELDAARTLLAECGPPELRGFEWHYLRGLCRSPLRHEWKGRMIRSTTPFTSTGLIVGLIGGQLHLYDARSGRVVDRFPLSRFHFADAISPDGRRVALLSGRAVRREIVIRELPGGRHLRTLSLEKSAYVRDVFFSADGESIAAVVEPRTYDTAFPVRGARRAKRSPSEFRVWNVVSGQPIRSTKPPGLRPPSNSYKAAVASVSGDLRLLVTPDGLVDAATEKTIIRAREPVVAGAFDRNATLVAMSSAAGRVTVWDVASLVKLATWPVDGDVRCLAFRPGGSTLAAGCTDGTVYFRDVRSGRDETPLRTGASVRKLAFIPTARLLMTGHAPIGGQTAFRVWATSPRREMVLRGGRPLLTNWGPTAVFSPDGRLVAVVGADRGIVLHDATTGAVVRRIPGAQRGTSVAFNHDGTLVAASGDEGFSVWEVATGQVRHRLQPPGRVTYCTQVAFSPDGKHLAGAHERGATVWELNTGLRIKSFRCRGRCYSSVNFSSDGGFLCATAERGAGRIWNVADWTQRCRLPNAFAYRGDLSPDDTLLATADRSRIALVDTRSGRLKRVIPLPQLSRVVAFTPDGKRLATTAGPRILILDDQTGQPILTLPGHRGGVNTIAFSRDGRRLVSAGIDGTVRLWGEPPAPLRGAAPARTQPPLVAPKPRSAGGR